MLGGGRQRRQTSHARHHSPPPHLIAAGGVRARDDSHGCERICLKHMDLAERLRVIRTALENRHFYSLNAHDGGPASEFIGCWLG